MYLRDVENMNEFDKNKELNYLPKNVRQMGEIGDGLKIYVEDYVYTYLHQYASKNKNDEQIAFLIGEKYLYDDEPILLINGAIQGKFLINENGNLKITEDTWSYVYEKVRQYFDGYEVVGWMFTQPGYGILLTSFLIKHHQENFKGDNQVLFIVDPIEKEESFFVLEEYDLKKQKGYFIYYEKNKKMHEYMLDYKVVINNTPQTIQEKNDDVVSTFRLKDQEKKEEVYHRKFVNMLSAVCGALVVVCVIIGVGLLSNMDEMNDLKQSFESVTSNYGLGDGREKADNPPDNTMEENVENNNVIENESTNDTINEDNSVENEDIETTGNSESQDTTTEDALESSETSQIIQREEEVETEENIQETVSLTPETYTIKEGDSLLSICYKFYNSSNMLTTIMDINNIDNADKIYVGQEIKLPQP